LEKLLLRMLSATLRAAQRRPFPSIKLEQCLLHSFSPDTSRVIEGIVGLAGNLVDLVDVNDTRPGLSRHRNRTSGAASE
jgi:hypothetical protein